MSKNIINLSFIIPAYNEELIIKDTISSICNHIPDSLNYEIIVVNHNSTDNTSIIASSMGAKVINKVDGSIASARNLGASAARGTILIFLDADVLLTKKWMLNINIAVKNIASDKTILTGSWVSVPDDASWIEKA